MSKVIPTTPERLGLLLRLLDDDTPEVRSSVARELDRFDGDVSELLGDRAPSLSAQEAATLSRLLRPARRRRLEQDWIVPTTGATGLADDWEKVEELLRLLSDFLHDGITLRQPLGDALDLLTEDSAGAFDGAGAIGLVRHLLRDVLKHDDSGELNPAHYDLAGVAAGRPANALSLGCICLLVAQRLQAEVAGISLPGAFFLVLPGEEHATIIDPGSRGAVIDTADFAHRIRRYPREIRRLATRPVTAGEMLVRITEETATAFAVIDESEDALLMEQLVDSLTIPF